MRRAALYGLAVVWVCLLFSLSGPSATPPPNRTLSMEDRVQAQRAIEEVYWKHRIWPNENDRAKPSLDAVLSNAQIRAKVEDYLKKSNAAEVVWGRPITSSQLQAEMERMATQTRAPEVLREIFAALGDDPFLIAETLARQTLADRLIRNWYARDERFHGDVRRHAQVALEGVSDARQLKSLGADYSETTWKLARPGEAESGRNQGEIVIEAPEWQERLAQIKEMLDDGRYAAPEVAATPGVVPEQAIERLPLMTIGPLREEDRAFLVITLLRKGPGTVTIATAAWPKLAFDAWWAGRSGSMSSSLSSATGQFAKVVVMGLPPCAPDTWKKTPWPPEDRYLHTAVWTGSEMLVWGGIRDNGLLSNGARYNPSTDSWVDITTSGAPAARFWHTAVWTGSEMIVWGGFANLYSSWLNDGGRYSPSTDSWVATTIAGPPAARSYHTAVWTGSEMIVWGGYNGAYLNDGGRYSPSSDRWVATTTIGAPSARDAHTAVWTGTEMIVWGGFGGGDLNDGGRYDPSTDIWVATTPSEAPVARQRHTAVWTGSEMIVWGGYHDSFIYLGDGARYNPFTDSWAATLTSETIAPRYYHTAVWTGNEMIVWGGYNGAYLNDGGRYNPATDRWVATTTSGSPVGRDAHTSVWTGSEMIVWGGYRNGINLDEGGRYSPTTDSWLATTTSGTPAARYLHTAVWTGTEMIVWGGVRGITPLNDGGRYNPATDSWLATTTLGAPQPRSYHTAVWTGGEMIVWGGTNDSSGGRYNPTTDEWGAMSLASAPSPRDRQTAIWTGSEMIIWGGYGGGNLNSGGRYAPSTDSWSDTTLTYAPSPRREHRAIWTGAEMIVWGGYDGNSASTGGRYNPSNDSWSPTNETGAPVGRYFHSIIWTGTEMIVWSGQGGGFVGLLAGGGRYRPDTDTWIPTSTLNAPDARARHTAIWTGNEMIVWGGEQQSGSGLDTGGEYEPAADSWSPTVTSGAPPGRSLHSAVWTGTEMIVWGGYTDAAGYFNTGGRYFSSTPATYFLDADEDGYGDANMPLQACVQPAGYVTNSADCNDASFSVNPGAPEICNDIDDNCNGEIDDSLGQLTCGVGACTRAVPSCVAGVPQTCIPGPPAFDLCDGVDNDCNGAVDDGDADQDGFTVCVDCNDGLSSVYPGATETCNSIDDNCNTLVDEDASGLDSDGDGIHNACDNCPFSYNPTQVDTDHDSVGNSCDNCLTVPNPTQTDLDGDQRGDVCDNCPAAANSFQDDTDADAVGDVCDNCIQTPNPDQGDVNADFVGDVCDLNDGLILIRLPDDLTVEWQQEAGFEAFNWYRGDLSVLKGSGLYTQDPNTVALGGRECGLADAYTYDFSDPPVGKAVFFLVTGVHLGAEGSLGKNSAGAERMNANPCP